MFFKKVVRRILLLFNLSLKRLDSNHQWLLTHNKFNKFISPNTMLSERRLLNIIESLDYVVKEKVDGVVVECGVWKGGAMALAALRMIEIKEEREIHLFDSFEDICQPDFRVDGDRAIHEVGGILNAQGKLKSTNTYSKLGIGFSNQENVMKLLSQDIGFKKNLIKIHKGWFQDTLPKASNISKISILRLDGDWYASTKICLDHLYNKVADGGVIIIDDYFSYDGCKKAVDEFTSKLKQTVILNKIDEDGIFWIKGSRGTF